MTFGEKLRKARKVRGMTQAELAGDIITRNMLSQLENDQAMPSLSTLKYLSEKLKVPSGYLIDDISEFEAAKLSGINAIRTSLKMRNHAECRKQCLALGDEAERLRDDEIGGIIVECCWHLGCEKFRSGEFAEAIAFYEELLRYAESTVYDTSFYEASAGQRIAVMKNITEGREVEFTEPEMMTEYRHIAELWKDDDNSISIAELEAEFAETDSIPNKYRLIGMIEKRAKDSGDFMKAYECAKLRLEIRGLIK